MDTSQDYIKQFDQFAFEFGKEQIFKHTCQLLTKGGKYGYKPLGTCVLMTVDNKYFLLTASHVTKILETQFIYINVNSKFVIVSGLLRDTDLSKDKKIDLSYIQLETQVAEVLSQTYNFLNIDKIGHSHEPKNSHQYIVVGYPEINVSTEGKTVYSGANILLLAGAKNEVYDFYKFNKEAHFLLGFAGRGFDLETSKKSDKLGDPYGMSGCGLWHISASFDIEKKLVCDYMLVGIMIGFRKGKYHVLIGNRIEYLIDALINLEGIKITY